MTRIVSPLHLAQGAAAATPRFDVYTTIHKALRQFMADTLARAGRLDADDDREREMVLDQVEALLLQMRSHLQHENHFVHAAIEARRPGGSRTTAADHVGHLESMRNLEDEAQALRHARPAQRGALALRLYRHLGVFVGENLEHMHVEEIENHASLWELYTDDELMDMHARLLASIGPDEMATTARWMAASLNPQELATLFTEARRNAPPEAFSALLDIARAQLDDSRWAKLARALGEPPVPGLVTV